jgi:ribosome-binding ATPase
MALQVGIVGLPNVGKSTLFKALTKNPVDINNYPFCTIEPNVGVVEVPDERLWSLAKMSESKRAIPAVVEFVDIAGLVEGASKGEGLGNKFLANIREVDALVHVVRVFVNDTIIHVNNRIAPLEDMAVINTELILADLETITKRKQKTAKDAKSVTNKEAVAELAVLSVLEDTLNQGSLARSVWETVSDGERGIISSLHLLTTKPMLYVYNVSDLDAALPTPLAEKPHVQLDIKIEEELLEISKEEAKELGMATRLPELIRSAYKLLGLMSYFTTGPEETRSWTVKQGATAPEAGAAIHTDFQEKFIRAEVIHWEKLLAAGSWSSARDQGIMRLEGKDSVIADGDVIVFKV